MCKWEVYLHWLLPIKWVQPNNKNCTFRQITNRQTHNTCTDTHTQCTDEKFNVYFYSSGAHASLHECIIRRTDSARVCSVCVRSRRSENNISPKGSHLAPFSPSSRSLPSARRLQGFPFSVQERCQTGYTIPHMDDGLGPPFTDRTHQPHLHSSTARPSRTSQPTRAEGKWLQLNIKLQ